MNSFELPVSLQTTDTGEVHSTKGLLDCGASDMFTSCHDLDFRVLDAMSGLLSDTRSCLYTWDISWMDLASVRTEGSNMSI